jgi:hypothetical protein
MFRVGVATAVTEPTRSMGLLAELQSNQPARSCLPSAKAADWISKKRVECCHAYRLQRF